MCHIMLKNVCMKHFWLYLTLSYSYYFGLHLNDNSEILGIIKTLNFTIKLNYW